VNQHGYILGTLRGGLAGLVMFIMMLTMTEVIPLGWDIVHYYLDQRYVEPVKSEERVMLVETIRDKYERRSASTQVISTGMKSSGTVIHSNF